MLRLAVVSSLDGSSIGSSSGASNATNDTSTHGLQSEEDAFQ